MSETDSSRRGFLKLSGSAISGTWLAGQWPALLAIGQTACVARDQQAPLINLDTQVAADLAAIAAQIIPSDDTPGAQEAGVIYFIDGALDTIMRGAGDSLVDGVTQLNTRLGQEYGGKRYAQLTADQQIAVLQTEDQSPFFGTVRFLTIAGMFAMPTHGGNQNKVGWNLLGFDSRHGWQPPFGYYDAQDSGDD